MNSAIKGYMIAVLLFLYVPLFFLVWFSFNTSPYSNQWGDITLKWYSAFFADRTLLTSLRNSLLVAFFSSVIAVFLSVLLSYGIFRYEFKFKGRLDFLIKIVLISPDINIAIGLMLLFQTLRLSLGLTAIIISHVTFCIAYALTILTVRFNQLDKGLEFAARDLGANEWQTLRLVIIPNIMPAIISALFVCFTLSWDDFIFSFFNSSAGTSTLPVQTFALIKRGINPEINAIATLSLVFSFFLIYFGIKFQRLPNPAQIFKS